MNRYENKVVLITGAGDMAMETAVRLISEGAKVAMADFSRKALDEAIAYVVNAGYSEESVKGFTCDVTSQEACDKVVAEVTALWGKIDTMVATAGIIRHKPIYEMSEDDWQRVIDINLTGVFHVCKAVVPGMIERKYGRIVLISSIGGRSGRLVGCNYAASKAGINGMVMNLAYCLAEHHITVNSVAPGPLKGRMFSSMAPEQQEKLAAGIPLGRVGELADAAAAIAYLGSDDASWVTGEVLDMNGGLQY